MPKKYSLEEFIKKANFIHNNKYDYKNVLYVNTHIKVEILCPIHGKFYQSPHHHTVRKQGCYVCSKTYLPTTESFIEKANEIHNNKYDYSLSLYSKANVPVVIICPIHGQFKQTPSNHIHLKHKCPKCSKNSDTPQEFIRKCNMVHNFKYDYSKVNYINMSSKIEIICPLHGLFTQLPYAHLGKKTGLS